MGFDALLACADWKLAPVELAGPRVIEHDRPFVACEVVTPNDAADARTFGVLHAEWAALPAHPTILEAIATPASRAALVRFAAIDWEHAPVGAEGGHQLAKWVAQLALAFSAIVTHVPRQQLGRFARPNVSIDLSGRVRLTFLPCRPGSGDEAWPPELRRTWPHAEPSALVYVIACALAGLAEDITQLAGTPLGEIVRRCADRRPSVRPPTPIALWRELQAARLGTDAEIPRGSTLIGWKHFEDGLGWWAVGRHDRAAREFDSALEHGTQMRLAQVGWMIARQALGEPERFWKSRAHNPHRCAQLTRAARDAWDAVTGRTPWRPPGLEPSLTWPEARECGAKLEADRAFAEAVELYLRAADQPDRNVALARCYLEMGEPRWAIDFASRALAADPHRHDMRTIRARAHLARREPELALTDVEALIARQPDDGLPHYLRGRCLLGLGRPGDAREAFDRACQLSPKLLEALVLRRHTVRARRAVRDEAGVSFAQTIDLPAHLAELRDALAAGDVEGAIARLSAAAYRDDPEAQVVLGHCLNYAGRTADALVAFERAEPR